MIRILSFHPPFPQRSQKRINAPLMPERNKLFRRLSYIILLRYQNLINKYSALPITPQIILFYKPCQKGRDCLRLPLFMIRCVDSLGNLHQAKLFFYSCIPQRFHDQLFTRCQFLHLHIFFFLSRHQNALLFPCGFSQLPFPLRLLYFIIRRIASDNFNEFNVY